MYERSALTMVAASDPGLHIFWFVTMTIPDYLMIRVHRLFKVIMFDRPISTVATTHRNARNMKLRTWYVRRIVIAWLWFRPRTDLFITYRVYPSISIYKFPLLMQDACLYCNMGPLSSRLIVKSSLSEFASQALSYSQ